MRRKVSAFLGVAVAMLLSVVVAVPANAADSWVPGPQKIPAEVRYKYGYDYYKQSFGNGTSWTNQPLSQLLNPAAGKAPTTQNSAKPLTGKIIEPGKTVMRAPMTYRPSPTMLSNLSKGLMAGGKVLGMVGVGMGGTAPAPTNVQTLYAAKGIPAGCSTSPPSGCTTQNYKDMMAIGSCGIIGNCDAIGATFDGGPAKTEVNPLPEDLWAKLTGQKTPEQKAASEYLTDTQALNVFTPTRGCSYSNLGLEQLVSPPKTDSNFTWHFEGPKKITERPPGTGSPSAAQAAYDRECTAAGNFATLGTPGVMYAQCIDPSNGRVFNSAGQNLSTSQALNSTTVGALDAVTKGFKPDVKLCGSYAGTIPNAQVMKIVWYNQQTKSLYDSNQSISYMEPGVWYNPDPLLSTEEDMEITTTVDCQTPDAQVFTYSSKIKGTAAFATPKCPAGSELIRHDVKSMLGPGVYGGSPTTLDSGAVDPVEQAKYPDCAGGKGGCSMTVEVDGLPCVVGKAECMTWPQVAAVQPSRVVCKYGTYSLPSSNCNVLSNAYRTETGVVYDPKSGEWVAIDVNGKPAPSANPAPWNANNPNPTPGQAPGTTTATPGTSAPGFPTTGASPSDGCNKPAWSWNPVEWVYSPVSCALKDAFVPKMNIQARSTQIATDAAGTMPISWLATPIVGPGGGGCPNWVVHVQGFSENVVCNSSYTAAILGARGSLFGLVTAAMVWPLIRSIWYAAIPVLRVSPGSSK